MTTLRYDQGDKGELVVELFDNRVAAVLAWLWPGAGHFYQRRFAKGFLFMVCIVGTFFVGLRIGSGRVVYACLDSKDFRWQYFCQAAVGLSAFPALIQAAKSRDGGEPLWVMCERYPAKYRDPDGRLKEYQRIPADAKDRPAETLKDGFMAAPAGPKIPEDNDVLGVWHVECGNWFEIGTFYTVIAGLLNILAIYDAYAGPVILARILNPFDD